MTNILATLARSCTPLHEAENFTRCENKWEGVNSDRTGASSASSASAVASKTALFTICCASLASPRTRSSARKPSKSARQVHVWVSSLTAEPLRVFLDSCSSAQHQHGGDRLTNGHAWAPPEKAFACWKLTAFKRRCSMTAAMHTPHRREPRRAPAAPRRWSGRARAPPPHTLLLPRRPARLRPPRPRPPRRGPAPTGLLIKMHRSDS